MGCPAAQTQVVQLDEWMVGVSGCGQRKVYIDIAWRGWIEDTLSAVDREPHDSSSWAFLSTSAAASFAARGLPRAGFEMDCGTDAMQTKRIAVPAVHPGRVSRHVLPAGALLDLRSQWFDAADELRLLHPLRRQGLPDGNDLHDVERRTREGLYKMNDAGS